ncbi:MAG: hypothetical protein AAF489_13060 [Bacteroidota bacterium]
MKKQLYILLVTTLSLLSCEEGGLLIENDISTDQVTLLAPSENAQIASNSIQFDWEALEDATSYELQVVTPNFDNPVQFVVNEILDSLTNFESILEVNPYEWRVRAKNSNYETSYSSASFEVIPVSNFSDNTVVLLSPENNLITNESEQELSWEPINEAITYRIQLLENGAVISEENTTKTVAAITFSEGSLEWQVRAENGLENTAYAARNILIDITAPNAASLVSPADQSIITTPTVSFNWTREPLAGSTEIDSLFIYRNSALTDLVLKDQATAPFETDLENNTYYWLIKSYDEAGNESAPSGTFSFTLNTP